MEEVKKSCTDRWLIQYFDKNDMEILESGVQTDCTKSRNLAENYFKMIAHANVGVKKDKHYPQRGPYHWLAVSKILNKPLLVSAYQKEPEYLENVRISDNVAVMSVYKKTGYFGEDITIGSDHGKWAIVGKNPIADNEKIVCFGDANRDTSQLEHPGVVFCFISRHLWDFLYSKIDELTSIDAKRIKLPLVHSATFAGKTISTTQLRPVLYDIEEEDEEDEDEKAEASQKKKGIKKEG